MSRLGLTYWMVETLFLIITSALSSTADTISLKFRELNQKIRVTCHDLLFCVYSLDEAVVFLEHFAKLVVGQRDDFVILDAGHGFGGNHGVDDGLFSRLNGGGEDRTKLVVGQQIGRASWREGCRWRWWRYE